MNNSRAPRRSTVEADSAIASRLISTAPKSRKREYLTDDGVLVLLRLVDSGVDTKTIAYAMDLTKDAVRYIAREYGWRIGKVFFRREKARDLIAAEPTSIG